MPARALVPALAVFLLAGPALACPACRGAVDARVYGPGFASTLFVVLLPVLLVILVAAAFGFQRPPAPRRGPEG